VGKGAEIVEKGGGAAKALAEFDSVQGAVQVSGTTKIKTLADGTKVILYGSSKASGSRPTIAIQYLSGQVAKIRY
jgi:hypothetical protein